MSDSRTDRNNNPAAFTTDLAREAGLFLGKDYTQGDSFESQGRTFFTAKLLGEPISITIRLLNAVGYYTKAGKIRWDYIAIPTVIWNDLNDVQKKAIIYFHYCREGGSDLKNLFD